MKDSPLFNIEHLQHNEGRGIVDIESPLLAILALLKDVEIRVTGVNDMLTAHLEDSFSHISVSWAFRFWRLR